MNKKIAAILALLFLSATVAFSQNIQVKGTVIDANGDPVPFASIQLKGTKQVHQRTRTVITLSLPRKTEH